MDEAEFDAIVAEAEAEAQNGPSLGVGALQLPAPHVAAAADAAAEAARQVSLQQQPLLSYLQADPLDGILRSMRGWTSLSIRNEQNPAYMPNIKRCPETHLRYSSESTLPALHDRAIRLLDFHK